MSQAFCRRSGGPNPDTKVEVRGEGLNFLDYGGESYAKKKRA